MHVSLFDPLHRAHALACELRHIADSIALTQKTDDILVFLAALLIGLHAAGLPAEFAALGDVLLAAGLEAERDVFTLQLGAGGKHGNHDRGESRGLAIIAQQSYLLLLYVEVDATVNQRLDRGKHLEGISAQP